MTRTSLEIAAYLVWARATLKWRNLGQTKKNSGLEVGPETSKENLREAIFLGRETMRISGRLPFHCNCMVQSVALVAMLHRRKIHSSLRFGVRIREKQKDLPFAHSWVECGGRVILDSGNRGDFVPFG
jgi:hypothetical protein